MPTHRLCVELFRFVGGEDDRHLLAESIGLIDPAGKQFIQPAGHCHARHGTLWRAEYNGCCSSLECIGAGELARTQAAQREGLRTTGFDEMQAKRLLLSGLIHRTPWFDTTQGTGRWQTGLANWCDALALRCRGLRSVLPSAAVSRFRMTSVSLHEEHSSESEHRTTPLSRLPKKTQPP